LRFITIPRSILRSLIELSDEEIEEADFCQVVSSILSSAPTGAS
jgi:hypothetical protein